MTEVTVKGTPEEVMILKPVVQAPAGKMAAGREYWLHKDYRHLAVPAQRYIMQDLDSLIRYAEGYVVPEVGAIFYNEKRVVALHDVDHPAGNQAIYEFELSLQLKAWLSIEQWNQKQFKEFLEVHLAEIKEKELYEALTKLRLNAQIKYDASMDDERNYRVMFETSTAKGSSEIPKLITVRVPMFRGDETKIELAFRVVFGQPTREGEKPLFSLECIGFDVVRLAEVERQIQALKERLQGYQVFFGVPAAGTDL